MTSPTQRRHDELVALLTEIRDRLPERVEARVAPFDPDVIAANLEAIKHEVETPMRGHGGCCEPGEVTEDQPVGTFVMDRDGAAWERRKDGRWFNDETEAHFNEVHHDYGPLRLATPADLARVGIEDEPAPADDLPGEPVEPGDLRAGDRVAFTWKGERITGTLVSDAGGDVLRSDVRGSTGYSPNVVWRDRKWADFISDVRLIESAPREDPDEALAADLIIREWRKQRARAEEAEAERDDAIARAESWRDANSGIHAERDAALDEVVRLRVSVEAAEAERDALSERMDALRADVERFNAGDPLITPLDILARDDDHTIAARNLEALKHETETPMRGHGECCDRITGGPTLHTLDDVAAEFGVDLSDDERTTP